MEVWILAAVVAALIILSAILRWLTWGVDGDASGLAMTKEQADELWSQGICSFSYREFKGGVYYGVTWNYGPLGRDDNFRGNAPYGLESYRCESKAV